MFIRKKPLYNGKVSLQICENSRENGKVKQRVLRHVGIAGSSDADKMPVETRRVYAVFNAKETAT